MSPANLRAELGKRAEDEGFSAIAVAAAGPLRESSVLRSWIDEGRHASMGWMAREPELRSDPRLLLPDCRSVISLAMNYWSGARTAATAPGKGRVALYASGRDYHKVLGRRLKRLADWLGDATGLPTRSFVDTGPVLERAWAQRAGIGWVGKNANLLTRELGSWLLLGEILTVAELAVDSGPHRSFCGSCTACIEACPTRAIVAEGVVDANHCISYWTIEHRGEIPPDRRCDIGDWIFGCDVCQEVCPWNLKFSRPAAAKLFERRQDLHSIDAEELLGMDEQAFRSKYEGSSLMRAKWEGMQRNACVVLGNQRRMESLPALERAMDSASPVVRSHASWAAERISGGRK
jgi:epoxyqueuosine reductase